MKATPEEIKKVLLGYRTEMESFTNRLYNKRINIANGLKEMNLESIDTFDEAFGKEMFYVAITDLIRENEINDLMN